MCILKDGRSEHLHRAPFASSSAVLAELKVSKLHTYKRDKQPHKTTSLLTLRKSADILSRKILHFERQQLRQFSLVFRSETNSNDYFLNYVRQNHPRIHEINHLNCPYFGKIRNSSFHASTQK